MTEDEAMYAMLVANAHALARRASPPWTIDQIDARVAADLQRARVLLGKQNALAAKVREHMPGNVNDLRSRVGTLEVENKELRSELLELELERCRRA
jgi:dihydrofolate reductase